MLLNNYIRVIMSFCILLLAANTYADIFLTSENLNSSLKQMQRLLIQLQDNDTESRPETVYQLGVEADALAALLTEEVKAHGSENETLISLALERTAEMNLPITWYGRLKRFFYNRSAFKQYLDISPGGEHLADSQFRILEWDYYLADSTTPGFLLDQIKTMEDFLERFPTFENTSEIELYLAINYRDLWRQYSDNQELELARQQQEKTRKFIQFMLGKYQNIEQGEIVQRLLDRFNAEVEKQSASQ